LNESKAIRTSLRWWGRIYFWLSDRFYDELAWGFDFVTRVLTCGALSRWRKIALDYLPGDRILDVACGTGELLIEISDQASKIFGLDISTGMRKVVSRKMRQRKKSVPFVQASAHQQPFACGSFNAVVVTFPAGFLNEPSIFGELWRVLRPAENNLSPKSGGLVVVGFVLNSENGLLKRFLSALYGFTPEVLLEQFSQMAAKSGFEVTTDIHKKGIIHIPIIVAKKVASGIFSANHVRTGEEEIAIAPM
jgi:ubiquinone/menaquinone biosynthesis C-methylase UbiE